MNTLSATYNALKRHEDALLLQQKKLQLELRSLPENHPNLGVTSLWCCLTFNQMLVVLGTTMSNLATMYSELGQHEHAVEMQTKAIEFFRRVLPENHPNIGATWLWCFG
jgi:tetratricopeptide (TPR) repeat protein